jgi:nitrite reductase (NADH) small subunit
MSETCWIRVTTQDNVPPREGRAVKVGEVEIALFNLGDRFLAVESRCPHQGGPLSDGIVTGCAVVCPLHTWRVNLDSGQVERPAGGGACVRTYPTRLDGNTVLVQFPAGAFARSGAGRAA